MKKCQKCGENLPIHKFYRHAAMGDGHLSFCKECVKRRVRKHRRENDSVREYDRTRSKLPHRKLHIAKNTKRWRAQHPDRYKAQCAVNNAIRNGRLQKKPCACGEAKVHGHHNDYSKPLDVVWLCAKCHHRLHAKLSGPK